MNAIKYIMLAILYFGAVSSQADIKTTKNISLVSDYLFRGVTQTDDGVAIQGGMDANMGNAYGGIWFSNIDAGDNAEGLPVEMDVSFGYNNKFDGFNIDVEVITRNFLVDSRGDETEFRVGTSPKKGLDINLYRGIKRKFWYPEVKYEHFLPNRLYLDVAAGIWMIDDAKDDKVLTTRVELGRDFPEFNNIDVFLGLDYISDELPGNGSDKDDAKMKFILGVRKDF